MRNSKSDQIRQVLNHNEIAVVQVGYQCKWAPGPLRTAFDTVREWIHDDALDNWWLGAAAPGIGKGYRKFRGRVRRLARTRFEDVKNIELVRLAPGGSNQITDWSIFARLSKRNECCQMGTVPSLVGQQSHQAYKDYKRVIEICGSTYGFLIRQPMWVGPIFYGSGGNLWVPDDFRSVDTRTNHSWWGSDAVDPKPYIHGLLRDIYPESYLSQPYLDARLGRSRTTLKEWIEADRENRGTLEPYTDILTKWSPPTDKIPQIREELFRAGRVYYSEFFRPPGRDGKPGPFYRPDLSAPWEAPDPIPEIYRADYWKDKDPSLTY